jgi:hypothetical protein
MSPASACLLRHILHTHPHAQETRPLPSARPFFGPLCPPCLPYGLLQARENNFCSAVCLDNECDQKVSVMVKASLLLLALLISSLVMEVDSAVKRLGSCRLCYFKFIFRFPD